MSTRTRTRKRIQVNGLQRRKNTRAIDGRKRTGYSRKSSIRYSRRRMNRLDTHRRRRHKRQTASRVEMLAKQAGYQAGTEAMRDNRVPNQKEFQSSFIGWYSASVSASSEQPASTLLSIAMAYRRGYFTALDRKASWIPLPIRGRASAVVSASNEENTLPSVIRELRKLPLQEIIVVLNGCKDDSFTVIEQDSRVTRLSFPERLGHDVARSIGAATSTGDMVLFTDGDIPIAAEELALFLLSVDQGADVVLNDISPYLPVFARQDEVTRCKLLLNLSLGRGDLHANSMTAVPHALSRRAIDTVGLSALMVPPKAQALALLHRLRVQSPHSVDVVKTNRVRAANVGSGNAVAGLILGDHVEALGEVMTSGGVRLRYSTLQRSELAKVRNAK